ncbi:MAG: aminotransferase class IV [Proteobacteria bacterium]|nr:aminotransferase class IV [Pseudomonadota bacterium]MBU2262245.1 aminotransferase class IV [Pseudomonadota bacterium]
MNKRVVYLGGEYRPWDEAKVHIMCHSFGRGSAIFEVIGFHGTGSGPAVFRLDEYVSRFFRSASLLEMVPPLSPEELQEAILQTVKRSGLQSGFIKVFGFYPEISFKILPPQQIFQVAVFVFSPEEALGDQQESVNGSVTACVSRWRRLDPQTVPVEAKVAANYVNGMAARMESRERGFDYAVLLDTQGFLAEGGTESLFLVREGRLLTPSLGTVLQSVTRKSLLAVAEEMGIETFAGRLSPGLLEEAEEIFFSGTSAKLLPVRQAGDRVLEDVPGPVTRRLAERMATITSGRDSRFQEWLFPAS